MAAHSHHRPRRKTAAFSLLAYGALGRLIFALGLAAILWLAYFWATRPLN